MKRLQTLLFISMLALPSFVYAQRSLVIPSDTLKSVVARLLNVMNSLVWPLIGLAILFFFYALVQYVYKSGDSKARSLGRTQIIWSLIGIFVIFSLWGLVNLISIFLLGQTPPGVGSNGATYAPRPGYTSNGSFGENGSFQGTNYSQHGQYEPSGSFQPQ